jgi:thioredoxin reductase (NADPH)
MSLTDVVVIGAGPAGLTAAVYLGRFHRKVVVIDGGDSRARWIPRSHNIPGFVHGIAGTEFLAHVRVQARQYGANIHPGAVSEIHRSSEGFLVATGSHRFESRYVILATGIKDRLPPLPGAAEAVLRSLLRICPICDAFEATGRAIAIIGDGEHGAREAEFLRVYSDNITLIHIGPKCESDIHDRLSRQGIQVLESPLEFLKLRSTDLTVHLPGQEPRTFDVCYCALGCVPQNQLATSLGARRDTAGALIVNSHQETSIRGLYAAGDVVRGLNQVVVAGAEAAIAATDIHNQLRRRDSADNQRRIDVI